MSPNVSYGAIDGWRLPMRCGDASSLRKALAWLSSDTSALSINDTSTRCSPSALQRREDADRGVQAADEVDHRGADLQRPAVGLARDVHQAAHRLQQQVVAGQVVGRRTR